MSKVFSATRLSGRSWISNPNHTDETGNPLVEDGVVGPLTLASLLGNAGSAVAGSSFAGFDIGTYPGDAAMAAWVETTVVNVSFFKHYREVEHRDGSRSMAWAKMKRTIYSLAPLRELLAANRRYLEFISAIEDDRVGTVKLQKISRPIQEGERSYRGFNFFDSEDEEMFETLAVANSTSAASGTRTCATA